MWNWVRTGALGYYFTRVHTTYAALEGQPGEPASDEERKLYPARGESWLRELEGVDAKKVAPLFEPSGYDAAAAAVPVLDVEGKHTTPSLRVVTLNMEMGRELDAVIANIARLQPDIVMLQEVDIGVPRTKFVDQPAVIAQAAGLPYVQFVSEVEEPCIMPRARDTPEAEWPLELRGGRQGNAILSRYPIVRSAAVRVPCERTGKRLERHECYKWHVYPVALVDTPIGLVQACSLHLDPHIKGIAVRGREKRLVGCRGRKRMFARVVGHMLALQGAAVERVQAVLQAGEASKEEEAEDEREREGRKQVMGGQHGRDRANDTVVEHQPHVTEGETSCLAEMRDTKQVRWPEPAHMVLAGDLNTVRSPSLLSPGRWFGRASKSVVLEPEWFVEHALGPLNQALGERTEGKSWSLRETGEVGDVTLYALMGGFQKKLDWTLVSPGLRVVRSRVGDRAEDKCSDHYWVCTDVALEPYVGASD